MIRNLEATDLGPVVDIHTLAFPCSALTALGAGAVNRYYQWLMTGPHDAYNIAALSDGSVKGFCFSGIFRGALTGFLGNNRGYLAWCIARRPWLVANPLIRSRMRLAERLMGSGFSLRRTKPPQGSFGQQLPESSQPKFGILSIAVHPEVRGTGAAAGLMAAVEEEALRRGFDRTRLTVAAANQRAFAFYEKLGWEIVGEAANDGLQMEKTIGVQFDGSAISDA